MWALLSPDGVAPSWTVGVSVSFSLALQHKVQKFSTSLRACVRGSPSGRSVDD